MQIIVEDKIRDNARRFLVLDCLIILLSISMFQLDKKLDQATFGGILFDTLQKYQGQNIIIGGDFNLKLEDHKCILHGIR